MSLNDHALLQIVEEFYSPDWQSQGSVYYVLREQRQDPDFVGKKTKTS